MSLDRPAQDLERCLHVGLVPLVKQAELLAIRLDEQMDQIDDTALLDFAAFAAAPLPTDPFPYLIVPEFLGRATRDAVAADFPRIDEPGSFPASTLRFGPRFARLLAALEGPAMRDAVAAKFAIDLTDRPTMITLRGRVQKRDGRIHPDSKTKLITVLIYMNSTWEVRGGRLRLLRSSTNLADYVAEVPPVERTLLAFKVARHSWLGHEPSDGERRVIQLNWVTSDAVVRQEEVRHRLSARVKRLFAVALPYC
jgi:SM-20-related protein